MILMLATVSCLNSRVFAGDVATLDPDGYMAITDRSKDVIKSGGEWISSIDLENEAMGHPGVAEAAVIGLSHPKFTERPLLVVVLKKGVKLTGPELLQWLATKVAKWSECNTRSRGGERSEHTPAS